MPFMFQEKMRRWLGPRSVMEREGREGASAACTPGFREVLPTVWECVVVRARRLRLSGGGEMVRSSAALGRCFGGIGFELAFDVSKRSRSFDIKCF